MNMIDFFKNLQFIFRPDYWVMTESFNREWDEKLNLLMDKFPPVFGPINDLNGKIHTVSFGGVEVWVENYPYGYGTPHSLKGMRPSRVTILRLHKLINAEKITRQLSQGKYTKFMNRIDGILNS